MADQVTCSHGGGRFAAATLDCYNCELRDADGFIGDRVSKRSFLAMLEDWRARLREIGADPLGDVPTEALRKKRIDRLLSEGSPEAAGVIHSAIEDFAQAFAEVVRQFLALEGWAGTERIMVGGGLRGSRAGELAIGRAGVLLKAAGIALELRPIRHHPDEAGLIGAAHLAPRALLEAHDSLLAVDVGGTNLRAGVVELNLDRAADLAQAHVMEFELWRHRDDQPTRDETVGHLAGLLQELAKRAIKRGHRLAPFVGIGCPGVIAPDGGIRRGGQNLPGDWEDAEFNLPEAIRTALPRIAGAETMVVLHNDAVVQGLSEMPLQTGVRHWGVLTIGTGLGNARFTTCTDTQ